MLTGKSRVMAEPITVKLDENGKEPYHFYTGNDLSNDYYGVLIEKRRPKWCRALWLIVTTGIFAFTIYMVYKLLNNYFQYKSYNTVSEKYVPTVALPAMTICSTNAVNYTLWKSVVSEFDDDNSIDSALREFLRDVEFYQYDMGEAYEYIMRDEYMELNKDVKDYDPIYDYAYNPYEFLLGFGVEYPSAKFGTRWINMTSEKENDFAIKDEYRSITELGYCIALNDNQDLVQTIAGVEGGFTIDLDAKVADYLPSTKQTGFKLFLRNPNETLILDQGGILISPGTETFVSLHKFDVERLKPRHGTCRNDKSPYNENAFTSVRQCVQEITLETMVDECNCIPWYLNKLAEKNPALRKKWQDVVKDIDAGEGTNSQTRLQKREDNVTQSEEVEDDTQCGFTLLHACKIVVLDKITREKKESNKPARECYEPCKFMRWDYTLFFNQFPPSEEYFNVYMKDRITADTPTFDHARKNFARLHVYYDELKVANVEQEKAYEIYNFIAEFGGATDLLIGLSFFLVFQAAEILIAFILVRCCQTRTN